MALTGGRSIGLCPVAPDVRPPHEPADPRVRPLELVADPHRLAEVVVAEVHPLAADEDSDVPLLAAALEVAERVGGRGLLLVAPGVEGERHGRSLRVR